MSDTFLQRLIPDTNRVDVAFAGGQNGGAATVLEVVYGGGFVGAFNDTDDMPDWARRAARYMEDDFLHNTPGTKKHFADIESQLADGAGETHINCRYALELWEAGGRKGPAPFSLRQSYGSCVCASRAEHADVLFAVRAAKPELIIVEHRPAKPEQWKYSCAWYDYAERGYCSDGWGGSGIAAVARRVGEAFRIKYVIGSDSVDFTDGPENEKICARKWCSSGIPSWLKNHTSKNHPYADGAITRFSGGKEGIRKLCANGGVLHHSGTRTSGGPKPFTIGSVGPHMQSLVGMDDSDNFRKFCAEVLNVTPRTNDFPVANNQTWGPGWSGETADKYWPFGTDSSGKMWTQEEINQTSFAGDDGEQRLADIKAGWGWGPKPEGIWVWWASDMVERTSLDYAWMPWVTGFPSDGPTPLPPAPNISGELYGELIGDKIAIRGEFTAYDRPYIVAPKPQTPGVFVIVQKQIL